MHANVDTMVRDEITTIVIAVLKSQGFIVESDIPMATAIAQRQSFNASVINQQSFDLMGKRFAAIDARYEDTNRRLAAIDARLEKMDTHCTELRGTRKRSSFMPSFIPWLMVGIWGALALLMSILYIGLRIN